MFFHISVKKKENMYWLCGFKNNTNSILNSTTLFFVQDAVMPEGEKHWGCQ
jgi:hypothetical protein